MPRKIAILNPDEGNPGVFVLTMREEMHWVRPEAEPVRAEMDPSVPPLPLPPPLPPPPRPKASVVGTLGPVMISGIIPLMVLAREKFSELLGCDIRCGDHLIELLGHTDRFYIEMPDGCWGQEVEARELLALLQWLHKAQVRNGTLLRRRSDGALIAHRVGTKEFQEK